MADDSTNPYQPDLDDSWLGIVFLFMAIVILSTSVERFSVGLENPMVDPFVQLNTKHSSVDLSR